ncbi:DNA methyltransferase [Thalassolituus oleivorans]|uniref:DNA methyltransferase n=1 Tax=Thalassolituus oleivorans TaxID=187493 RepID=UPI00042DDE45|nr:DNA methyltransferase [Thalassolituus oleivorans]AHK15128.1 type III restriction-modification system methylation subunit [Thalassolituus oleivorans R6-15]
MTELKPFSPKVGALGDAVITTQLVFKTGINMSKFNELVTKLREVFQIDRPELDFGVYRILNARADEINEYLEKRLKEKVEKALATGNAANLGQLQEDLKKAEQGAEALGVSPDAVPKVQEIKEKIAQYSTGANENENAVFSHLLTFFSRYYDNGDFISQRRYKGDTYAIPYAGEEVMLHWANKDQYYIKSGENFSNYSFKLQDGRVVHFRLIAADTAKDNRKDNDKERRFVLAEQKIVTRMDDEGDEYDDEIFPVEEITKKDAEGKETKELIIRFEYKAMPKGSKQDKLVEAAVDAVLADSAVASRWLDLSKREPTEKNPKRTLLEKQLSNYTTKNTADYFIHKNLGKFLRGELDFYIKNEVMHLDDVQNAEAFSDIEKSLRMIQCLRSIALDLIKFLAQLEDFQKKLWTKKKFVVQADYCITLDLVPESLFELIIKNERQITEWKKLYAIEDFEGYSESLSIEFLKKYKYLVIDTSNFDSSFRSTLLQSIDNFDQKCNGLLLHGDNYHGLRLIRNKFLDQVKCVYLDPPYNTDVSAIPYKNNYRHSSWATMMNDRLALVQQTMSPASACYVSIDKNERDSLIGAMNQAFGEDNKVEELIWIQNTNDGRAKTFSTNHEYIEVFSKDLKAAEEDYSLFREPKPGFEQVMLLVAELNPDYPSVNDIEAKLRSLYKDNKQSFKARIEAQGLDYSEEKRNDPWNGVYQYKFAEYRDQEGRYVEEFRAKEVGAKIWVFRESDWTIMEADQKQSGTTKDPENPNYRYYRPNHPITGKPVSMPSRGWKGTQFIDPKYPKRNSWESLINDNRIACGADESKVPQQKRFLHEVETNVAKSIIVDYSDGEKETTNLFGRKGVFLAPKHTNFVGKFVRQATSKNSWVLDIFGGSGSTAGAVIECNRADELDRNFILMETNTYIDSTILPRIKKTVFASKWRNGKPESHDGVSLCLKFQRLESYEDALNNLELKKPKADLFDNNPELKDDYLLNYMLDVESRGSLLSTDDFKKPFDYTMKIAVDSAGAFAEQKVDLVETFNYLVGLTVKHIDAQPERGFVSVTGTLPSNETCLVLWRDCEKIDYEGLNKLCDKLALNPADNEFDVVYINGDHNIPTVLTQTAEEGGETRVLKLRQIEPEFLERMFAEEDV